MKNVNAYYNDYRWIADCPKHGNGGAMVVENEYICPLCHPGIVAQLPRLMNGRVTLVPDTSARRTARLMAEGADEVYAVVYPAEKKQIEEILNARPILPNIAHAWIPGETIADLLKEDKIVQARAREMNK